MSRLRGKLEDGLGVANEAEFVSGDAFDGLGVFLEPLHLALELADAFGQAGIFSVDLAQLGLKAAEARQSIGCEHEHGGTDAGDDEDKSGQDAFKEEREPGHGPQVATKSGRDPRGLREG